MILDIVFPGTTAMSLRRPAVWTGYRAGSPYFPARSTILVNTDRSTSAENGSPWLKKATDISSLPIRTFTRSRKAVYVG